MRALALILVLLLGGSAWAQDSDAEPDEEIVRPFVQTLTYLRKTDKRFRPGAIDIATPCSPSLDRALRRVLTLEGDVSLALREQGTSGPVSALVVASSHETRRGPLLQRHVVLELVDLATGMVLWHQHHHATSAGPGEVPDEPRGVASYQGLLLLVRDFAERVAERSTQPWPAGVGESAVAAIEVEGRAAGVDPALFERALREGLTDPFAVRLQVGRADLPRVAAEAARSGTKLPSPLPRDLVVKASIWSEPRAGKSDRVFVRLQLLDPARPEPPLVTSMTSTSF